MSEVVTIEDRIAARIDTGVAQGLSMSMSGGAVFQNSQQVMEFAKMMAMGGISVPKHLRGAPGACLAVIWQALEWGMSPFAVANKSYSVNDRLSYEAGIVHALAIKRAPFKGRPNFEFIGDGEKRKVRVWVELKDEPGKVLDYTSPEIGKIHPKNSPLWKTDPDQQLTYYGVRSLVKRHFPDVLHGVYTVDEIEDSPIEAAKDVTPRSITARLDALADSVLAPKQENPAASSPAPVDPSGEVGNSPDVPPTHDPETGEVMDDDAPDPRQAVLDVLRQAAVRGGESSLNKKLNSLSDKDRALVRDDDVQDILREQV